MSPEDVPRVFDDACIKHLAGIAKVRLDAHPVSPAAALACFGDGIRWAVGNYLRRRAEPRPNQVHEEIRGLYSAAARKRFVDVAGRVERLSVAARREMVRSRAQALTVAPERQLPSLARTWANGLPGAAERILGAARALRTTGGDHAQAAELLAAACIPSADLVRDPKWRDQACEAITRLASYGGRWTEGRKRPTGKRSRTWEPLLNAPPIAARPPRREAERELVGWLQRAYFEASNAEPALTASAEKEGPFVRFVRECLKLAGAAHVDPVELINKRHRTYRLMERRLSAPKT